MLNFVPDPNAAVARATPFRHRFFSLAARRYIDGRWYWSAPLCALVALLACKVHAKDNPAAADTSGNRAAIAHCLPDGSGYLKARLKGAIDAELDWGKATLDCTGAVRPTDGGIRMRFTGEIGKDQAGHPQRLVIVFGIANLREGANVKALPVNVTIIREGTGEFYGTRGDDKCTLDDVKQTALVGIPHRTRSYRVEARGFCTEPARAVEGSGAVLISRFDYAGRVDFDQEQDDANDPVSASREPDDLTSQPGA